MVSHTLFEVSSAFPKRYFLFWKHYVTDDRVFAGLKVPKKLRKISESSHNRQEKSRVPNRACLRYQKDPFKTP